MEPTKERIEELVEIYREELGDGMEADLNDYHSWDHLIESYEEMTFEEWEWMHQNYTAKPSVKLVRKPAVPA